MNIEETLKQYTNEDGVITADKMGEVAKAINSAVGKEFVEKDRYNKKLTEIDTLKAEKQAAEDNATTSEKWKTKYDALKDDFDAYKKEISAKETKAARESAYKSLLKEAGISEKRIDSVLKVSDIDSFEFDEEGKIKDADKLTESIKKEWADFIVSEETKGAEVHNPPTNNGGGTDLDKMSMADYIAARKNMRR